MKVGFIGLGRMGAAMAANLLKSGHQVTIYNRTPAKAQPLIANGAQLAGCVAEACRGEAVVTMLADDQALAGVSFGTEGILASLAPDAVHISCSTISIALSKQLADSHRKVAQRFVAAPVFGRPQAAEARQLFIIAAGDPGAITAATPLLDAMGQKTVVAGEAPESANLVKLSGNFLIASVIESFGEASALAAKGGIEPQRYLEIMSETLFNLPVFKSYGTLIAAAKFTPAGFAAPLGLKDVKLALEAGDALRVPLPLASLLRDRFLALLARGGEELDWSAIGRLAAADAGLQ
jgi:3-hydroxyisobutyrate dehydrogenase-like beta-hydroxyacid dehydrogenase